MKFLRSRAIAGVLALAWAAACAPANIVVEGPPLRRRPHDMTPVRVVRLPKRDGDAAAPIAYSSGMMIDTDGFVREPRRRAAIERRDPDHLPETSLRYADGSALDPVQIPYVVLPVGYDEAKIGDLAVIRYRGRSVLAVVGDRGPEGVIGEASIAAAESLGIDSDGATGGVEDGVTYTVYPGTGLKNPRGQDELLDVIYDQGTELCARHLKDGVPVAAAGR
ncbi:MAG: glycoside hydrolase family 75 protein [Elusimicrobiota bacterium]